MRIENDGPSIVATDYWTSDHGKAGAVFLSINAGAFRLLVRRLRLGRRDGDLLALAARGGGAAMTREITHTRHPDGYLQQIVSPARLRAILDEDGEDYSRPTEFGPADEWEVEGDDEDDDEATSQREEPKYTWSVEPHFESGAALIVVDNDAGDGAMYVVRADGSLEIDVESDGCGRNSLDPDGEGWWPEPPDELIAEAQALARGSAEDDDEAGVTP
jgi:hypothetical protein